MKEGVRAVLGEGKRDRKVAVSGKKWVGKRKNEGGDGSGIGGEEGTGVPTKRKGNDFKEFLPKRRNDGGNGADVKWRMRHCPVEDFKVQDKMGESGA